MSDWVAVPFAGEGSGVAELSWGQLSVWQSIEVSGQSRTVPGMTPLPPAMTVPRLAAILGRLVSRHQALRTRYRLRGERPPLQECFSRGELRLEVVDAGDRDPAEVATEVLDRLQRKHFDYENEWPLRVAAVTRDGVLTHQVVVYLHMALDAGGLLALIADMRSLDPETGEGPPVTALQPLEQAAWQGDPAAHRQQAGSLRYFEQVLRAVPAQPFGPPKPGVERDHVEIVFRSPATHLAARAAAARYGGTSPVLMAAFATAVARAKGTNPVLALIAVSNRFRPRLGASVSSISQVTPLMIDVGDATLDEAVTRAARSALSAYKNGYSDPYEQDVVVDRVNAERGEEVELICYWNDKRDQDRSANGEPPSAERIRAALADSTVDWPEDDPEKPRTGLYVYVDEFDEAVQLRMAVDLRYWSRDELQALVREIEAVTVAIALDPAASTEVRAAARV